MARKVNKVRYIKLSGKAHPRDNHQYKNLPWLNMSGVWLQEAGFNIGDRLQVNVSQGQLTITNGAGYGDQNH